MPRWSACACGGLVEQRFEKRFREEMAGKALQHGYGVSTSRRCGGRNEMAPARSIAASRSARSRFGRGLGGGDGQVCALAAAIEEARLKGIGGNGRARKAPACFDAPVPGRGGC